MFSVETVYGFEQRGDNIFSFISDMVLWHLLASFQTSGVQPLGEKPIVT